MKAKYLNSAVLLIGCLLLLSSSAVAGTPQWHWNSGTCCVPYPDGRDAPDVVYNPSSNRLVVFGGGATSGVLNDLWVLTNADGTGGTPTWSNLIPNGAAGSPPGRSSASAAYDVANDIMMVFGGCHGYCSPVLNDVWVLNNATGVGGNPTWTQLSLF